MSAETIEAPVSLRNVTIPVVGMTCASCVNRVEKAIARTPGVESAAVNLATEQATVSFDPALTTIAGVAEAVRKAGYEVGELPVEAPPVKAAAPRIGSNGAQEAEVVLPIEG
ncbi:MAG: heavy-metal-associated domain-containing protein, partial [Chloroflexia bacterium]|nr:heavy-metal-associated domain-containing protein [Chloroflexia bacterium]